jgi:hypothetical protein
VKFSEEQIIDEKKMRNCAAASGGAEVFGAKPGGVGKEGGYVERDHFSIRDGEHGDLGLIS